MKNDLSLYNERKKWNLSGTLTTSNSNRYVGYAVPRRGSRVGVVSQDPAFREEVKGEPCAAHKQARAACGHDPHI